MAENEIIKCRECGVIFARKDEGTRRVHPMLDNEACCPKCLRKSDIKPKKLDGYR